MTDVVAQNILFSIIQYTQSDQIRRKISWLRTAGILLKKALEKKSNSDHLLDQVNRCLYKLDLLEYYNWETFERYRAGNFDLLDEDEYRIVLNLISQLERTKDNLLEIFVEAGYTETSLASIG